MDSAALLDLLGNENRRRILRLLAQKPCYVTEISDYLGVSPKAVIDHLGRLEEAGMVESYTDDQRRKYFHVARNLRLEVNVSPHEFGARSAYPASPNLDMSGRCRYLSIDVTANRPDGDDVGELAAEFERLEQLEKELSLARRWVHGRVTDVLGQLSERLGGEADSRFYAEVLATVAAGERSAAGISEEVGARPETVEGALATLADRGLVRKTADGWELS